MFSKRLLLLIVFVIFSISFILFVQNYNKNPSVFVISKEDQPLLIYSPVGDHEITLVINLSSTDGSLIVRYQDWDVYAERNLTIGINDFTISTDEVELILVTGTSADGFFEIIEHGREGSIILIFISLPFIFAILFILTVLIIRNRSKFKSIFSNKRENNDFNYKFGLLLIDLTILLPFSGYRNILPYIFNLSLFFDNPPNLNILVDFSLLTLYLFPMLIFFVNFTVILFVFRNKMNNQAILNNIKYFFLAIGLLAIVVALIALSESSILVGKILLTDCVYLLTYGMLFSGGVLISEYAITTTFKTKN